MTTKPLIFGPVPSRRLGLSLGIDLVPFKTCSLDCVYCQLGKTTFHTVERKEYVPLNEVIQQIKQKLSEDVKPDYLTLSGSGEPTLYSKLGQLISSIKEMTEIPVALITNSTLFSDAGVRAEALKTDLVLPSLDACDQRTFDLINRPLAGLNIDNIISGLQKFRNEYTGQIWLEIFFVEGINTKPKHLGRFSEIISIIKPDKVQLNTAVRPTAEYNVGPVSHDKLKMFANQLGADCEVIADYSKLSIGENLQIEARDVLAILKRRPCRLEDICSGLNIHKNHAIKALTYLLNQKKITTQEKNKVIFYKVV